MSEEESKEQRRLVNFALRMAGDIAATIAVPVSVLTYIGRRADLRLGTTKPYFVVLAIIASFLISTVFVSKKALDYGDKYVKLTKVADEKRKKKPDDGKKKPS